MPLSEAQIENRMAKLIRTRGGLSFKFISPGNSGVPDRIVIIPGGRIIFVELKAETGSLAKCQQYQLDRLKKNGAEVRVIKGYQEAKAFVDEVFPL